MIGNIYISGEIGIEVNLIDIVGQVKGQPEAVSFKVHINSPGGFVDAGFDIFNYIRSIGKPIETIGSGLVASIATVIFMAGSSRSILPNTQFMIHLPWMESAGNADELEQYAKELRAVEKQLMDFYKKELNLSEEALQPLLRDESWLTPEQLQTLGFTTSQPLPVTAKAFFKPFNKSSMTEEDKGFFTKIFGKLETLLSPKIKNKVIQDATGTEIDFTDLADDAVIEVGAKATVDGTPAEGEYLLPDGFTYVFAAGELMEIKDPEGDDELAELRSENERLTQELADAQASHQTQIDTINTEFNKLKAKVKSQFNAGGKKETPEKPKNINPANRFAGAAERIKNAKNK
jgi:ATP-dependent protease ClpP protease subunit